MGKDTGELSAGEKKGRAMKEDASGSNQTKHEEESELT